MNNESIHPFMDKEEDCQLALFAAKWPDGFRCPHCSHPHAAVIRTRRLPLYQCRSCRLQTSLIASTIMEGSRTSLTKWFQAIHLHSLPSGISASRLSRIINVTYKTAWLICHKIRHAMSSSEDSRRLAGLVRINASLYGRYESAHSDFPSMQVPLLIAASIGPHGEPEHMKIKLMKEFAQRKSITMQGVHTFIENHLSDDSLAEVIGTQSFYRLRKLRCPILKQTVQEARVWIRDTFQGIGPKHLQVYLDQFIWMLNARKTAENHPFDTLLSLSASLPVITYPVLIGKYPNSAQIRSRPQSKAA
ncbi:transposase [Cohnella faecalis]|uniref:Transposase n=1 Tax=Cohnella faecalis TaxID=2315694 RepID=A0A398CJM6_9BACL|nr:transposase [Cohnella faecalis]RIE02903.1 transposase [Cohnella faecalis]